MTNKTVIVWGIWIPAKEDNEWRLQFTNEVYHEDLFSELIAIK